jgi:aspartate 4-decarboxylase
MDELASLSPFELKDMLIKVARGCEANTVILGAGRGNPIFLATLPRYGFCQLNLFAMCELERPFAYLTESVGTFPRYEGIEERFQLFAHQNKNVDGIAFLCEAVSYVRDRLHPFSEKIIRHYLHKELFGTQVGQ